MSEPAMIDIDALARAVAKLPGLYDELGDLLGYHRTGGGDDVDVMFTRVDPPLPINADASDMRRRIVTELDELASAVASAAMLDRRTFGRHPLMMATLVIAGLHLIDVSELDVAHFVELAWIADLVTSGVFDLNV